MAHPQHHAAFLVLLDLLWDRRHGDVLDFTQAVLRVEHSRLARNALPDRHSPSAMQGLLRRLDVMHVYATHPDVNSV